MEKHTVAVVGIGYVGLPLAVLAKEKGWNVIGIDISQERIDRVNKGDSPIDSKEVAEKLKQHPIEATTDFAAASRAEVIIIAVPTPVNESKEPDLGPVLSATQSILPHLQPGQLIIMESTINPGVMDLVVMPELRKRTDLSFDADGSPADVYVAHCPERINPGDKKWSVRNIPRVLGGYSNQGIEKANAFYSSVIEAPVKIMESITEAEAVKIFENSFRDVNIAFVNEMARSFDKLGIDVMHVIEGASTKPFAFLAHYPGNGVGGHCISVDPYYMIKRAAEVGFDHQFLKLARYINDDMAVFTLELLERGLQALGLDKKSVKVAHLGLAYKRDVGDLRESPAVVIKDLLRKHDYSISVFDPYRLEQSDVTTLKQAVQDAQVIMLATNHTQFIDELKPAELYATGVRLVIDGKNALDGAAFARHGILYYGIGRTYLPANLK